MPIQTEPSGDAPSQPKTHHISDIDTWGGHPDRSYITFVILSVMFGFLGLDHFYLRSFGTGTQKLLINVMTLGSWYWWDIIQIAADGQKIRTEGLNSPLDWVRGIGRGTFTMPAPKEEKGEKGGKDKKEGPTYGAKKSYLLYAFLAIFFGWLGADKFYLGEVWQGVVKVISCFNIFLFLFGWLWVFWDSFHAFFLTDSILVHGITPPMPYNMIFNETVPGDIFKVGEVKEDATAAGKGSSVGLGAFGFPLSFGDFCSRWLRIPIPTLPVREIYREIVAPLMTPPVVSALKSVGPSATTTPTCFQEMTSGLPPIPTKEEFQASVIDTADKSREVVATVVEPVAIAASGVGNAVSKVQSRPPLQSGGGRLEEVSGGPGPVIAGALTAVVLAGGLKGFYDILSKQYG